MEQFTTPVVGERTAHLLNAVRMLELLGSEVYAAFEPLGEEFADRNVNTVVELGAGLHDALEEWIAERVRDWAASAERPAEF